MGIIFSDRIGDDFISIPLKEKEKEEIIALYTEQNYTFKEITKITGRSISTIHKILKENNITTKQKEKSEKLIINKDNIKKLYLEEKLSTIEIGKLFDCEPSTIRRLLNKMNIKLRSHSEASRKYNIDETFFDIINTEEKAYILGFLYADGWIIRNQDIIKGFAINLSPIDEEHLIKIRNIIKAEQPIYHYNNKEKDYVRIAFYNLRMGKQLIKLGCIPSKSLILKYPTINQVPLQLQHHFIRGYFDGDGSIINNIHNNSIEIAGTQDFLSGIKDYLKSNFHNNITKTENIFRLRISNRKGILEFYNKIYKDATIYLDRKYQKFQQFLFKYKETIQ